MNCFICIVSKEVNVVAQFYVIRNMFAQNEISGIPYPIYFFDE